MKRVNSTLWHATAEHAPSLLPLQGNIAADVVIIGCGILGAVTALTLAKKGISVAVLESDHVGSGASSRPGGFVVPTFTFDGPQKIIKKYGDVGARLVDATGRGADRLFNLIKDNDISCDAKQGGWYQPGHDQNSWNHIQSVAKEWQNAGFSVSLLDGEETRQRTGVSGYLGSWVAHDGGTIQPLSYVRGLVKAAQIAGAVIFEKTPALRIEKKGKQFEVSSSHGSVVAEKVIVSTNAQSHGLVPDAEQSIVPMTIWQCATAPIAEADRQHLFKNGECLSDTRTNLFTYRFDRDWRLITGVIGAFGMSGDKAAKFMAESFKEQLKLPAVPPIDYLWTGVASVTRTRLPQLSVVDESIFVPVACNGRGIVLSTVIGEAIAQSIASGSTKELPLPITAPRGGFDIVVQKTLSPFYFYSGVLEEWRSRFFK